MKSGLDAMPLFLQVNMLLLEKFSKFTKWQLFWLKMTTFLTQDNFEWKYEICKFDNLSYNSHFFLFWDKSCYLSHNFRILDQMETTKVIWEKHLLSFLLASFLEHWLTTYSLHYCFYVNKEPLPFLYVKDNQPSLRME